MLPNIRLMIAATFAAVLMLIFGFGMFASFRVSHAPFERVAAAGALHPFAAHAATPPLMVSAEAPFNNRFESGEPGSGSVAALAYAAPEPDEQPETNIAAPAADDHQQNATEPTPEPPSTPDAPVSADVQASAQQAALSETASETKPDQTPAAATPSVPSAEPATITLVEPPISVPMSEPAQAPEPDVASVAPATESAPTPPDLTTMTAQKKAKHPHTATRTHVTHKARVVANAVNIETRTTFQTAPEWPQLDPPNALAKITHTSTTPKDMLYGTGGPFISAPGR
jgi:hypothetical protein